MIEQSTSDRLINWIESRRSLGNLDIPAPNDDEIKQAIHCAMTAPDHKKLKPWRFIVIKGNKRHKFGRALLSAGLAKADNDGSTLSENDQQKLLKMPIRAPVIITVTTCMKQHEKVPEFEQLLSAGASVQNLILALQAQGFSSVWRTGPLANEAAIKQYFNVTESDYVVGFIYVGTAHCVSPIRTEIDISSFVSIDE